MSNVVRRVRASENPEAILKKKTRHEGDEGTVAFWLWMKALYKDEE